MPTFGLIAEGATDQQVIQAILDGVFDPEEIDTRPFLPIADQTFQHQVQNFSNWQLVLEYCASPKFEEAFPFVDYVVVQIDTDKCDDPKFGVRKEEGGQSLPIQEIITRVAAKLKDQIGQAVWDKFHDRILFAIAVETTECWLLPLYAAERDKGRHLNCLDVLNRCLRRKNRDTINPAAKKPRYYAELARPYSKRKELIKYFEENASLHHFVARLETLRVEMAGEPKEGE